VAIILKGWQIVKEATANKGGQFHQLQALITAPTTVWNASVPLHDCAVCITCVHGRYQLQNPSLLRHRHAANLREKPVLPMEVKNIGGIATISHVEAEIH